MERTLSTTIDLKHQMPESDTNKYITEITDKGINVHPDKDNSWKVQISDGIYILDPDNEPVNQMMNTGNIIGHEDETHTEIDYHSMQLIDKDGIPYFHVSDLRRYVSEIKETYTGDGEKSSFSTKYDVVDLISAVETGDTSNKAQLSDPRTVVFDSPPASGSEISIEYFADGSIDSENKKFLAKITETHTGDGLSYAFSTRIPMYKGISAIDGSDSSNLAEWHEKLSSVFFNNAPIEGSVITLVYYSSSELAKAFTYGSRKGNIGPSSFSAGYNTEASGAHSHAEGSGTIASGTHSHAEGYGTTKVITTASGFCSHAEGFGAKASGYYSHAEGEQTKAIGGCSHAEGFGAEAIGIYSHAEGYITTAESGYSHAEGEQTKASGIASHAQNLYTIAAKEAQTAIGKYNKNKSDTAFEIGNGTGETDNLRSNAFTVNWDGNTNSWSKDFERDAGGTLNGGFRIVDKNGDVVAYMKGLSTRDSQNRTIEGFNIGTSRTVGSTTAWNALRMMIDADGNPVVTIGQPEAWREALGLGTTSASCTIASGWENYSSGINPIVYRYGKVVTFVWECKPTESKLIDASLYTVCTIPSGYRPPRQINTICQSSGTRIFEARIKPDGTVSVSRLRNTDSTSYDTATTNYWFSIHMTYVIS